VRLTLRVRRPGRSAVVAAATIAVVLVALRLPSLFEPAWSADEGAYADIGRSLDHGSVLYRDVWDNKPPGIYWLAAAVSLGHASVFRMQVLLFAVVAGGAIVVWMLGRRIASNRVALLTSVLYITLTSLPVFSGDQLNTEVVAAVPAAAAMMLMLGGPKPASARRFTAAGGLLAIAFLADVRAAADLLAVASVPFLFSIAERRRTGRRELRAASLVVAGWAVALGLVAVPLAIGGSLTGLVDVLANKDTGYLEYFQTQAQFGPGVFAPAGAAALVVGTLRVIVVLALGGVAALAAARRGSARAGVAIWWLSCGMAAVMLNARSFTHYVQLAGPALALSCALAASAMIRLKSSWRYAAAGACIVAMWPVALLALYLPPLTASLTTGAGLPRAPDPEAAGTVSYFIVGWERVLGLASPSTFDRTFHDDLYPLDLGIAALMRARSGDAQSVYLWGGHGPWTYALADRRPSARFVWMGSAYDVYPGSENVAIDDLAHHPPAALIAEHALPDRVQRMLRAWHYSLMHNQQPALDYWVAP
jgi:hypothetical protein